MSKQEVPAEDSITVEYVVGPKQIARIKFPTRKQFELAESIRREYVMTVAKPTWSGFMKYMGVVGIRIEHDKPDKVVGFLDVK